MNALPGVIAKRTYTVPQEDGSHAILTFTWADPGLRNDGPWKYARKHKAQAFGFIQIEDVDDAPEMPVVWMVTEAGTAELLLVDAKPEKWFSPGLQEMLEAAFNRFYEDEIKPQGPSLGRDASERQLH
jgi:hypothetical protein